MAEQDRVTAVVVNHDAGEALLTCVASLRDAGLANIVVVDNASSDGSLTRLAAKDGEVVLVPTGANLGYGTAANRGAARSESEYLLICNPDLTLDADAVKILVSELDAHPELGAVGPRILNPGGTTYPSARAFPNLADAAGHALIGLFVPDNPFSRRYRLGGIDPSEGREVDWVSGAFVLLRRVAFSSIGGFDEGYFMYVEDLDLCWRLHRAGWSISYVPDALVTHVQGSSAARYPFQMLIAHHRSTWRFATRRYQGRERLWLVPVGAGLGARLLLSVAREIAKRRNLQPKRPD